MGREFDGAQFNSETGFVVSFLRHNVFDCQLADLAFRLILVAVFKFSAVKDFLLALDGRGSQQLQVLPNARFHCKPGRNFRAFGLRPIRSNCGTLQSRAWLIAAPGIPAVVKPAISVSRSD